MGGVILWVVVVVVVAIVTVAYLDQSDTAGIALEGMPEGLKSVLAAAGSIVVPVAKLLFFAVAPADQEENVQAIAFALFLLLFLIGNEALRTFIKNRIVSVIAAAIMGIIASRSITNTILEQTALAAGPIATVTFILGFIPIFALTKYITKSRLKSVYSYMIIYTIAGIVYALIFHFAFEATILGIVYGAGIVALGATEMIIPHYQKKKEATENRRTGQTLRDIKKTEEAARTMAEGYDKNP